MNTVKEKGFESFFSCRNKYLTELIETAGFKGYSLYDSNNSVIDYTRFGHKINFLINQIVKRGPSWIRPLIGVKQGINPKLLGLYLLYANDASNVQGCIENILKCRNEDGAWGYNYTWPRGDGTLIEKGRSNVVVTYFVFMGLKRFKNQVDDFEEIEVTVLKFLNSLVLYETESEACFSYFPNIANRTLNASLFALELLLSIDDSHANRELGRKVVKFVLSRQNQNGSFPYSENIKDGSLKAQYDFHQYYVLSSLKRLGLKIANLALDENIKSGLIYTLNYQLNNGKFYWRYPKMYPIDIHNQAAAILTLRVFADEISDLKFDQQNLLKDVVYWNEQNLWSGSRYYYQYYPFIKIRTNYLRWNQGWMLAATSENHIYSI